MALFDRASHRLHRVREAIAKELLARLRAQLRTFENNQEAILMIGQYVFRPAMMLLHDQSNDRHISLTTEEAELLKFLCRLEAHPVIALCH